MRISDWSSDVCSSDLAALLMPVAANAQAYKCDLPTALARPKPDLPSKDQPRRLRAIGGYTLAIKWAPQFCHDRAKQASAKFQCGSGKRFGFTHHGLWPDGTTQEWPPYCRPQQAEHRVGTARVRTVTTR